jgi:lipid-A-disaccharide synthase
MVNLIAGRRIVPELIQEECTPRRIATETLSLLTDSQRAQQMREALEEVCGKLGGPGASGRAAEAVLEVVRSRSSS